MNYTTKDILEKVGGKFRLTSILQKRMAELNAGAKKLVDISSDNPMDIVFAEIMQDKLKLEIYAYDVAEAAKEEGMIGDDDED